MNLSKFLINDKVRNLWIEEPHMRVYVRRSFRNIGSKTFLCLDCASVEVDEDYRGKGIFSTFLIRFEKEAKKLNRAVFVESIQEPRLRNYLLTIGYKDVPGTSEFAPNMYKIVA